MPRNFKLFLVLNDPSYRDGGPEHMKELDLLGFGKRKDVPGNRKMNAPGNLFS